MNSEPTQTEQTGSEPVIACEVCLKEIPHSLAKSHEAAEYVYYFCGDECFGQWEAEGRHYTEDRSQEALQEQSGGEESKR